MEIIRQYFLNLSDQQLQQFSRLETLYHDWNSRINVISRKDIDQLYLRHVLHALAIAKFINFTPGTKVIDVGTGGGFPGIPLAIYFPETYFYLLDSIQKKVKVVEAVTADLKLKNTTAKCQRIEEFDVKTDFVVSRAVASTEKLYRWTRQLLTKENKNSLPNGLILLKGGDVHTEIEELKRKTGYDISKVQTVPVGNYFPEDFFDQKYIVYIPV